MMGYSATGILTTELFSKTSYIFTTLKICYCLKKYANHSNKLQYCRNKYELTIPFSKRKICNTMNELSEILLVIKILSLLFSLFTIIFID